MKTNMNRRVAIALALATSAILSGCGSNNSAAPITPGATGINGIAGVNISTGCAPISAPIAFAGTGIGGNGTGAFAAGQFPGSGSYGAMEVGTATTSMGSIGTEVYTDTYGQSESSPAGEAAGSLEISFESSLGISNMGFNPYNYGYTNGISTGSNTLSGYLQLSEEAQNAIMYTVEENPTLYESGYGYGTIGLGGTSSICVSNIAIIGYLYPTYEAYGGFQAEVALYLNNTEHGYILYWY
jgi:hypothetical protein